MNDEQSPKQLANNREPTLEERLSDSPHVHKRMVQIVDLMDKALAEGYTADEAEEMAIEQVNKLGGDILSDWAVNQEKSSFEKAKQGHPNAIADGKKNSTGPQRSEKSQSSKESCDWVDGERG